MVYKSITSIFFLLPILLSSCFSYKSQIRQFTITDIELVLVDEREIEFSLSNIGVIDITQLANKETIDNLDLKVARIVDDKKPYSIVLLDKNGNGKHNDFNIDLLAFAPNQWSNLNGERFQRLNFFPLNKYQSFFIYDHFETINHFEDNNLETSISEPSTNFFTFPYIIPTLKRATVFDKNLEFTSLLNQGKFIFFEFWGTWCKPCVAQIPDLKKIHENHSDKIFIIGISSRDSKDKLNKFITKYEMNWPQIMLDDEIDKYFGEVLLYPTGFLFDSNGKLIGYGLDAKDILNILNK